MWVQVYVGHTVSMIHIIYLWDNNIRVRKLLHLCKGRKAPFVVCTLMWRDNYSVWTFSTWHKLTNYSLVVKTKEIRDLEVIAPICQDAYSWAYFGSSFGQISRDRGTRGIKQALVPHYPQRAYISISHNMYWIIACGSLIFEIVTNEDIVCLFT